MHRFVRLRDGAVKGLGHHECGVDSVPVEGAQDVFRARPESGGAGDADVDVCIDDRMSGL
ncbi:hypothetical protein [Streptomyces sp. NPDC015414]|uniref:hypothetical protein n=1 Tax=Streptomyces sp. NPDC015414 TaxID=3364957 RepID=UPI0036F701A0